MWEPAVSGMGNAHNCVPKLQAYPPIFSLTLKASGSTSLQSCEVHTTEEEFITAGTYARDFMKKYYGNEKILVAATETYCSEL